MAKPPDESNPPRIVQTSFGANSPNIVGDNNQIFINERGERMLTVAAGARIANVLKTLPPSEVIITAYLSAEDGQSFGAYVGSAVFYGGWKVRGDAINRAVGTVADRIQGLAILVKDMEAIPEPAKHLQRALMAGGLRAPIVQDGSLRPADMVLWIGRR